MFIILAALLFPHNLIHAGMKALKARKTSKFVILLPLPLRPQSYNKTSLNQTH